MNRFERHELRLLVDLCENIICRSQTSALLRPALYLITDYEENKGCGGRRKITAICNKTQSVAKSKRELYELVAIVASSIENLKM